MPTVNATHAGAADAGTPAPIFVELGHFALIRFAGDEAQPFLQAQLSCDVNALLPGQAQYGSYNSPKGRMLANFVLWRDAAGYVMQLPRSIREPVQKRLTMYILRSKVKATDISDETILIGVAGERADSVLAPLCSDIPAASLAMTTGNDLGLLRLGAQRYEIIAPANRAAELRDALKKSAAPAAPAMWDWMDIRAGIAQITTATQDQFVPQMANLDALGGISFSKGCYPGQEIVARMHYRGQLKQRMYAAHVAASEAPQPGDKVYSADMQDQASGMIVNAAPAPDGGYDVLAVIRIASVQSGAVHWKSPGGPALGLLELPYKL